MRRRPFIDALVLAGAALPLCWAIPVMAGQLPEVKVTNVRRVFHNGEHNAFTDLVRFHDKLYLTFRSCPDGHMVHPTASIIVLSSTDAKEWKQVHRFSVDKRDTRDPHFLVFKDTLFVYTGTWYCGETSPRSADYDLNQHLGYAAWSKDGAQWNSPILLEGTFGHYIWRASAFDGKAYLCGRRKKGFAMAPRGEGPMVESAMLESDDGLIWRTRALFQQVDGDETAFQFEPDGSIVAIGRRGRDNAQLLRSERPYTQWERKDLDRYIGGPLLTRWGGRYVVGGRKTMPDQGPVTSMCWLVDDRLSEFAELPSGGDNSYPGLVEISPSHAIVSWYSSHERDANGRAITAIYLADLEQSAEAEVDPHADTRLKADDPFACQEGAVVRGSTCARQLALLFTGHEFAEGAEAILEALARHDAKASFFLTGDFLRNGQFAPLVRRMLAEGHYVGPHSDRHRLYCTWTPDHRTLLTRAEFETDLNDNLRELGRFGVARTQARLFLPAYEHYNRDISDWAQMMGLTLVNLSPGTRSAADYTAEKDRNFVSSQAILDSILRCESQDRAGLNGFLLLMHLGAGPERMDKMHLYLPELLSRLKERGYTFERVDRLLARHLRASQVGYPVRGPKLAVVLACEPLPRQFDVVEPDSGRSVLQGSTGPVTGMRWGRFKHVAELDFTALRQPGRFRLRIGGSVSLPIVVDDAVFRPLPDLLLEFMRQQRCGFNPWLNAACHQLDGRTAYGPLPAGTAIEVRGGWHDAADLLKYLLTSSNATAQMLLAWEMCRRTSETPRSLLFDDRFDALGQSGANGLPDLLDEARWGLEWMLKLHPASGQLYHQVGDDRDHCGWRLPQDERADYGWGQGGYRVVYAADGRPQGLGRYRSESTGVANLAGRYAAAMALAFQIWKDDPNQAGFARRCLTAGEEVYQLGRDREGVQQGNSYGAPYRYAETTWTDDMEWGAAELFRATGNRSYLDDAKRYADLARSESWMGREEASHYQFYPFFNAGHFRLHGVVDVEFQRLLEGWYREGIERCRTAGEENAFGVGVPFIWCSNNLVVALVTQCLLYEQMTGDDRYREFAARHRDWLLGRNPWGTTQFMGVGIVWPENVHLMTTRLTGRTLRGGLVDGPVYERIFNSLKGVSITEPDPLAEFQDPRAVYHDDWQDYASNEPTMDGTASAILMWAAVQTAR